MNLKSKTLILLVAGIFTAVVISVTTLSGISASIDTQTPFSVDYDTDRTYGDYKHFDLAEANHKVCQDACAADAKCKAYTYTKPWQEYSAHCWLKDSVPAPVKGRDCCTSGVKGGTPAPIQ